MPDLNDDNLSAFLRWFGRGGQAVRNTLRGDFGRAGKHVLDFAGEIPDAFLPGDVIPNATGGQDFVEFSDLVGMDETTSPWLKIPTDIVGGIATDPLSFLPATAITKPVGAAWSAGMAAPVIGPKLTRARDWAADTFNYHNMTPDQVLKLERAHGAEVGSSRAQAEAARGLTAGAGSIEQDIVRDAIENVRITDEFQGTKLDPARTHGWMKSSDRKAEVVASARKHPAYANLSPEQQQRVESIIDKQLDIAKQQWIEDIQQGIVRKPELVQTSSGVMPTKEAAKLNPAKTFIQSDITDPENYDPFAYLQRPVARDTQDKTGIGLGTASFMKDRTESDDYLSWLNQDRRNMEAYARGEAPSIVSKVTGGRNAPVLEQMTEQRIRQQAGAIGKRELARQIAPDLQNAMNAERASIRQHIADLDAKMAGHPADERTKAIEPLMKKHDALQKMEQLVADPGAVLVDKDYRDAVAAGIGLMKNDRATRDFAVRAETIWKGMDERGPVTGTLAEISREFFKKPATVGVLLPRFSFMIRNRLGALQQAVAGSEKGLAGAVTAPSVMRTANPANIAADLFTGLNEGLASLFPKHVQKAKVDELAQRFDRIDQAFKASGGDLARVQGALAADPMAQELVRNRLISGGVSGDELIEALATAGDDSLWRRLWDAPAKANEAIEVRMRAGFYQAAREIGKMSEAEAVVATKKALLDYDMPTSKNRALRDFFPFAAFMTQTIPQTVKSPLTLSAASNLYAGATDDPIYPSMEGNINLPWGQDEKGNPTYLTGTGLPLEAIGDIPLGTETQDWRKVLGQLHPFAKTTLGVATGQDAYYGTPFGSYDKNPAWMQALGADETGDLGRWYSMVRGTGMIQPAMPIIDPINTLLDERLTGEQQAARLLTGARIASVDPDRAAQQQIEEALRGNPAAKTHTSFYTTGEGDEEINAMLEQYREATKKVKAKWKAQQEADAAILKP